MFFTFSRRPTMVADIFTQSPTIKKLPTTLNKAMILVNKPFSKKRKKSLSFLKILSFRESVILMKFTIFALKKKYSFLRRKFSVWQNFF